MRWRHIRGIRRLMASDFSPIVVLFWLRVDKQESNVGTGSVVGGWSCLSYASTDDRGYTTEVTAVKSRTSNPIPKLVIPNLSRSA